MEASPLLSSQVTQLQRTVNLNILSMAKSTQIASATVMLEDFTRNQNNIQAAAPHPTLGKSLDLRV